MKLQWSVMRNGLGQRRLSVAETVEWMTLYREVFWLLFCRHKKVTYTSTGVEKKKHSMTGLQGQARNDGREKATVLMHEFGRGRDQSNGRFRATKCGEFALVALLGCRHRQ